MYSDHYGFSEKPFQLTPDPRFWYESRTHRKAMAYLGYGLAQGEGFIVITGDIGAGKTTLVGHLLATIDRARFTAINVVSTQVEGDDMLRLVAQGLGLPTEGVAKAQVLDRIERSLDEEARAGRNVLLIVDEAQNLPNSALEELRMLSNYQVNGRSLVQIFLLGQPEFRDRMRESAGLEQLRQRVIATHHLDPMESDEVEPYIRFRLKQAGYQGNPVFAQDVYPVVFDATGGVPRTINTLMGRVLLAGAIEGLERIDGQVVEEVAREARAEGVRRASSISSYQPAPSAEPDRIAALEARLVEQEATLQRILGLLINWVEADNEATRRNPHSDAA